MTISERVKALHRQVPGRRDAPNHEDDNPDDAEERQVRTGQGRGEEKKHKFISVSMLQDTIRRIL